MFKRKSAKLISCEILSAAVPSLALQAQGGVVGEATKPDANNAAKKEVLKDEPKSSGYLRTLVKILGWVIVAELIACIYKKWGAEKHKCKINQKEGHEREDSEKFKKREELRKLEQLEQLEQLTIGDFEKTEFCFLGESYKDLLNKMAYTYNKGV